MYNRFISTQVLLRRMIRAGLEKSSRNRKAISFSCKCKFQLCQGLHENFPFYWGLSKLYCQKIIPQFVPLLIKAWMRECLYWLQIGINVRMLLPCSTRVVWFRMSSLGDRSWLKTFWNLHDHGLVQHYLSDLRERSVFSPKLRIMKERTPNHQTWIETSNQVDVFPVPCHSPHHQTDRTREKHVFFSSPKWAFAKSP